MVRTLSIITFVALSGMLSGGASAQQVGTETRTVVCTVDEPRLFERYPGLNSHPITPVRQWGVGHARQVILDKGCTTFVRPDQPSLDLTSEILARLDADHALALGTLQPVLARANIGGVTGLVTQADQCELQTRYVIASRPDIPYGDGRTFVIRLDQITSIEAWESGKGFRFYGGVQGQDYREFGFETEAEAQRYLTAFVALAAPCMARARAS